MVGSSCFPSGDTNVSRLEELALSMSDIVPTYQIRDAESLFFVGFRL